MAGFRRETERLVLRDWRDDDWVEQRRMTDTPELMRWLGGLPGEQGRADLDHEDLRRGAPLNPTIICAIAEGPWEASRR